MDLRRQRQRGALYRYECTSAEYLGTFMSWLKPPEHDQPEVPERQGLEAPFADDFVRRPALPVVTGLPYFSGKPPSFARMMTKMKRMYEHSVMLLREEGSVESYTRRKKPGRGLLDPLVYVLPQAKQKTVYKRLGRKWFARDPAWLAVSGVGPTRRLAEVSLRLQVAARAWYMMGKKMHESPLPCAVYKLGIVWTAYSYRTEEFGVGSSMERALSSLASILDAESESVHTEKHGSTGGQKAAPDARERVTPEAGENRGGERGREDVGRRRAGLEALALGAQG